MSVNKEILLGEGGGEQKAAIETSAIMCNMAVACLSEQVLGPDQCGGTGGYD